MFKILILLAGLAFSSQLLAESNCNKLNQFSLAGTITAEQLTEVKVEAAFARFREDIHLQNLPEFCRIQATLNSRPNSSIGIEVWLPTHNWNGRYLQVGNAGFAGTIPHLSMAHYLHRGYAVAGTDSGHHGYDDDASWALGPVDKLLDFGYRAVHDLKLTAKNLIEAYYGNEANYSYFTGCSNGGREGWKDAQLYPGGFDGYLLGAPASFWTYGYSALLYAAQRLASLEAEALTIDQIKYLSEEMRRQCASSDGINDELISQPQLCKADTSRLLCQKKSDAHCLSARQKAVIDEIYYGLPEAGVYGFQHTVGTEDGPFQWPTWFIGPTMWGAPDPLAKPLAEAFFRYKVYQDPDLDIFQLDPHKAAQDAAKKLGPILNADNPDIAAVRKKGSKIIQYHGWADAAVPAQFSPDYYRAVERKLGSSPDDFFRLFMVPGMGHCIGNDSPSVFNGLDNLGAPEDKEHDVLLALQAWVEQGRAPEYIIASQFGSGSSGPELVRTRPICPYPRIAKWNGTGSSDEAKNFHCVSASK